MPKIGRRNKRERERERESPSFFWIKCGTFALVVLLTIRNLFISLPSMDLGQYAIAPTARSDGANDYSLAKHQSLGFFDDIPSSAWKRLQNKTLRMSPNFCNNNEMLMAKSAKFFQCHYEPDFVCTHEERIGAEGDGGKWTCDPHRIAKKVDTGGDCLVYSVGSSGDFSFEMDVHQSIHKDCEIHTFDPNPKYQRDADKAGGKITYHAYGLGVDQVNDKGRIFKSMDTVIGELGHQNRIIEIFKIDCEWCEWETAKSWLDASAKHNVTLRQIQVELHTALRGEPLTQRPVHAFFDLMYEHGYVIFHKEPNIIAKDFHCRKMNLIEYAFLKLDPEFVNAEQRPKAVTAFEAAEAAEAAKASN